MESTLQKIFLLILISGFLISCGTTLDKSEQAQNDQDLNSVKTRNPNQPTNSQNGVNDGFIGDSIHEKVARLFAERSFDEETIEALLEAEFSLYTQNPTRAMEIYERLTLETEDPEIAKRSANIALLLNDDLRALDAALQYLDMVGETEDAIQIAAKALTRAGEVEGAWELAVKLPSGEKSIFRTMASEALRKASKSKDPRQPRWLLRQLIEQHTGASIETMDDIGNSLSDITDQDHLIALGILFEALGQQSLTLFIAERIYQLDPKNLIGIRLLSSARAAIGDRQGASMLITEWIETHPQDPDGQFNMAQTLVQIDPQAGLSALENLSQQHPWVGELRLRTAQIQLQAGQFEKAIPHYKKLTGFGKYRMLAHTNLGQIYEQLKQPELAIQHYQQVTEGNLVYDALRRSALININLQQKNTLEVEQQFDQLREVYPDKRESLYFDQAKAFESIDDRKQAIALYTRGIEEFPKSEPLLYARSLTYEYSNQVEEALTDLRTILEYDDANPAALNALGYTLAKHTDQLDEAYDLIDRALSIDPEDPAIIDSMGWVLHRMGRSEEAVEYLEKALLGLYDEEVVAHLLEVLLTLGRDNEAAKILVEAKEKIPGGKLIQSVLQRFALDPSES